MAFFTSQQLFGNGAGAPGGPGWVPIDLAAPPTYTANNRGIAFGEQLTSAIANRSHYALAKNDDDLNTRLAAFEVGGLDAAYDNGTIGPAGGGRIVTKDAGAIETESLLAAPYADDIANAHFRANQLADVIGGGVGFESVSFGRTPGVGYALYGFHDRRAININNYSIITDTITATLNQGGLDPSGITVGGGAQWTDLSGNTDLFPGLDHVEVLSGPFKGLYFLNSFSSQFLALVSGLDGGAPTFAPNTATTVRIFRSVMSTGQGGVRMFGVPATTASLSVVGNNLGRFDTLSSSKDGPRFSLRHLWRNLVGSFQSTFHIDGQGQLASTVSTAQLTAAQIAAGTGFGAPAYIVQQDGGAAAYEVGFLARSNDANTLTSWLGVATAGHATTPTTVSGVFAFNFINIIPYNLLLADIVAVDWQFNPTVTLVEILTPAPQAGIYKMTGRDPGTGRIVLTDLEDNTLTLPSSGAGTLRLFFTQALGARTILTGTSLWAGGSFFGRAGATFMSPKELNSTALLLEAGNQNATPTNYWLIRGIRADDGATEEVFSVDSEGRVAGAGTFQTSAEYTYKTTKTYRHTFPAATALNQTTFTGGGYVISSADPEFFFGVGTGDMVIKSGGETVGQYGAIYPVHLPDGVVVTKIGVWYTSLNGTVGTDEVRYTLCSKSIGGDVRSMKTGAPSYFGLTIDNANHIVSGPTTVFTLTETLGNRTVNNNMASAGKEWFLWIARPASSNGDYDIIYYSLWVEYTLTTIAGG